MCKPHFPKKYLLLIKSATELGYLIEELQLENAEVKN